MQEESISFDYTTRRSQATLESSRIAIWPHLLVVYLGIQTGTNPCGDRLSI